MEESSEEYELMQLRKLNKNNFKNKKRIFGLEKKFCKNEIIKIEHKNLYKDKTLAKKLKLEIEVFQKKINLI
jgi:hypothetical protein